MKKTYLSFSLLFFLCMEMLPAFSQNPLVKQWDYRFGGLKYDNLMSFQQTADGGYILGGWTNSGIGGDKTEDTVGGYDFWIVKVNALGILQWEKTFGGTGDDYFYVVKQTDDGGYLLGGNSDSQTSGDKTQNTWNSSFDFWIIKTDSLGNKQWDKDLGGNSTEYLYSIQQTNEGGYILGGYSNSVLGGDKTQTSKGLGDFWIVKTDSAGIKLWDRDLGGTSDERLNSVEQTSDGGYILGGFSSSGISGDKSTANWGNSDYWIVKTDSLGIKQWDKDFGGTSTDYLYSLQQTSDEGYILGGISISGISGDKTQPTWGGSADYDFWIIKTDSLGTKQWDKDFGGTGSEDDFGNITQTYDGGYLMGGSSYSNISGDKTENNLSMEQSWVVKTDALGNLQWDKTLHTGGHDECGYALQTNDGCYAMANFTGGGIAGDKTQSAMGQSDYWLIKFCDSTQSQAPVVLFSSPNQLCPGTCTNFNNLSFNATSFLWSFPGAAPSVSTDINPAGICYNIPGSYNVTLIASNSVTSDTLALNNYITVYPYPSPQGISQSGDTLFANPGAVSYQWYLNGSPLAGATGYFYVALQSGDYNVVATDGNGCEVEAVIFNVVAHVNSFEGSSGLLHLYPNPVIKNLEILSGGSGSFSGNNKNEMSVAVYTIQGEKISENTYSSLQTIDCSSLAEGMYMLEIKSSGQIFRGRFMRAK
jgi:PKD repeat protein